MRELSDYEKLLASFVLFVVMAKVLFFKEDILTITRTVVAIFWILVLPGFWLSYFLDLEFKERFVLSVAMSAVIVGVSSYYLGLIGIHITLSAKLLPAIFIGLGLLLKSRFQIYSGETNL